MVNYKTIWKVQKDFNNCLAKVPTVRKIKTQTRTRGVKQYKDEAAHTVQQLCQEEASERCCCFCGLLHSSKQPPGTRNYYEMVREKMDAWKKKKKVEIN